MADEMDLEWYGGRQMIKFYRSLKRDNNIVATAIAKLNLGKTTQMLDCVFKERVFFFSSSSFSSFFFNIILN